MSPTAKFPFLHSYILGGGRQTINHILCADKCYENCWPVYGKDLVRSRTFLNTLIREERPFQRRDIWRKEKELNYKGICVKHLECRGNEWFIQRCGASTFGSLKKSQEVMCLQHSEQGSADQGWRSTGYWGPYWDVFLGQCEDFSL